jgi:hypothetical protein
MNSISNNKLHLGPLTLCAKNKKQMKTWVDQILSFKHCKIDKSEGGKTLVEFNKVNELNRNGNALDRLYYNSSNTAYIKTQEGQDTESAVKKEISEISKTIVQGDTAHKKVMRVMTNHLRQQRMTTNKVLQKQGMIKLNLDKEVRHAGYKQEQLIRMAHQRKELKILHKLRKDIQKVKVKSN